MSVFKSRTSQIILNLTALIFFVGNVHAHNGNNGQVTTEGFTVWSNTYGSDTIRVFPNDGVYNPAGSSCSDPDSYMVSTSLSKEAQQRIYATLMAAVMAKHAVDLILDTNGCEDGRPKILHVAIK